MFNLKWKLPIVIFSICLLSAGCFPNFSSTGVSAGGILKSANGGTDWQFSNKIVDSQTDLGSLNISNLFFVNGNPEKMMAATYGGGLYVSDDAAGTWRNILSRFTIYDAAVDPGNSDIIYAAGSFGGKGRVIATKDNGKSWIEIYNDASGNNPVRAIAINPLNTNEILIGLQNGTLIRSSDAGTSWKFIQSFNDRINRFVWNNNGLYIVLRSKGVYRSNDSGTTTQSLTESLLSAGALSDILGSQEKITVSVFNQFAVSNSNPNLLYLTTDSGFVKSDNGGASWLAVKLPAKQDNIRVLGLGLSPNDDRTIYVGAGNTVYRTDNGGASWQTQDTRSGGEVYILLVHPQLPQLIYAGIYVQR